MTKNYQTETTREATVMPEGLMVAMADIAGAAEEGLLALAVATGFGGLTAMMDEDVTTLCGPKGRHDPQRTAVRHGSEAGAVTPGGRPGPGEGGGQAARRGGVGGGARAGGGGRGGGGGGGGEHDDRFLRPGAPRGEGVGAVHGEPPHPPLPRRAGARRRAGRGERDLD